MSSHHDHGQAQSPQTRESRNLAGEVCLRARFQFKGGGTDKSRTGSGATWSGGIEDLNAIPPDQVAPLLVLLSQTYDLASIAYTATFEYIAHSQLTNSRKVWFKHVEICSHYRRSRRWHRAGDNGGHASYS